MSRSSTILFRRALLSAALACAAAAPFAASAATATFTATLSSGAEVPINNSAGSGTLQATLDTDTRVLSWQVAYVGLSGPASAAHFHGPAAPGANAGVVLPFASPVSPIDGKATLTPAQVADLMAGKWYVNVHTAANPGGEIRGQVMPTK